MVRKREDMEALIALYLKGEASPEQAIELEDWRSENEENASLYKEFEKVYSQVQGTESFKTPDVDLAWEKVNALTREETKVVPLWRNRQFYAGIAAVAVVAFLIGSFWGNSGIDNPIVGVNEDGDSLIVQPTVLTAQNDVASFTLIDNSKVDLQPGSELKIMSGFNESGRNLELTGSGTFEVIHDEEQPFTISVEGLQVVDIGTVFDITTSKDTVKIVVKEGAVELWLNDEVLDVAAGDSAFYLISQQLVSRFKVPSSHQDKVFQFNGTKLHEVAIILGDYFDRKIVVMDDEIKDCLVTVTFKNESLATILDIVKELLDIKIVRNEDIIGIYGEGCL
ncbi:MAG: FecR domain-containing protein [Crocinitomicaceae bacterium]|nr:FecR domain-containing protein [Crocinitomicaceae bacterium]